MIKTMIFHDHAIYLIMIQSYLLRYGDVFDTVISRCQNAGSSGTEPEVRYIWMSTSLPEVLHQELQEGNYVNGVVDAKNQPLGAGGLSRSRRPEPD